MLESALLLVLLSILLVVIVWVYKSDNKKTEAPVFNITLHVDGLDNRSTENRQQTTSINESPSNTQKKAKKVIPIEEPSRTVEKDWKDITPTDSNL